MMRLREFYIHLRPDLVQKLSIISELLSVEHHQRLLRYLDVLEKRVSKNATDSFEEIPFISGDIENLVQVPISEKENKDKQTSFSKKTQSSFEQTSVGLRGRDFYHFLFQPYVFLAETKDYLIAKETVRYETERYLRTPVRKKIADNSVRRPSDDDIQRIYRFWQQLRESQEKWRAEALNAYRQEPEEYRLSVMAELKQKAKYIWGGGENPLFYPNQQVQAESRQRLEEAEAVKLPHSEVKGVKVATHIPFDYSCSRLHIQQNEHQKNE